MPQQQMGVAPLVALGWAVKAALWAGGGWLGYRFLKGAGQTTGPAGALVEGLGRAAPFIGGAVLFNYLGAHALPPRFAKYRWIPTTALAGIGMMKIAEAGTGQTPIQKKQITELKKDVELVSVEKIVDIDALSLRVTLRNNSYETRQVLMTLTKRAMVAGQLEEGVLVPIGLLKKAEAPWYAWLSPAHIAYSLMVRNTEALITLGPGETKTLSMAFTQIQEWLAEPGELYVQFKFYVATDTALTNPFLESEPLKIKL